MLLADKMKEIIAEQGIDFVEKSRTIYTRCPVCSRSDKFSIIKENGACICYRASCDFGKRWFTDWIILTANVSREEAVRLIKDIEFSKMQAGDELRIDLSDKPQLETFELPLVPISFPDGYMVDLASPEAVDACGYMAKRGVPIDIAKKYGVLFAPLTRRVIFPINMNGQTYGWQGRAVDNVPDSDRVRNNTGFRRDSLVMFLDNTAGKDFVIVCEGPFDAIKFDNVGGNVCTMGKIISKKQKKLIISKNIKKVYLALDADAADEMMSFKEDLTDRKVFLLNVPDSCRERCLREGKKADFGECTFDECEKAFLDAIEVDNNHIITYLK